MALEPTTDLLIVYRPDNQTHYKLAVDELPSGDGSNVVASEDAPDNPSPGDLWFNTEEGRLFIYYYDGNSYQWVDTNPASNGEDGQNGDGTGGGIDDGTENGQVLIWDGADWNPSLEIDCGATDLGSGEIDYPS